MKKTILLSTIFLLGIIFGYYFSMAFEKKVEPTTIDNRDTENRNCVENSSQTIELDKKELTYKGIIEKEIAKASNIPSSQSRETISEPSRNNINRNQESDDNLDSSRTRELKEWSVKHASELKTVIDQKLPLDVSKAFFEQVELNNDFLQKTQFKQEEYIDETWAYSKENELKYLIYQHSSSSGFELIQLTCKQLICEIVGQENVLQAWQEIYFSLLQSASSVIIPNDSGGYKPTVYFYQNNKAYIYSQLAFKE